MRGNHTAPVKIDANRGTGMGTHSGDVKGPLEGFFRSVLISTAWLAAFVAVWLAFDPSTFTGEVMVYRAWCPRALTNVDTCPDDEKSANRITYKASSETQSVVYWVKGAAPSRLTKCAVRDARNWSCNESSPSAVEMVDGKLTAAWMAADSLYQVPKYQWYWLWLQDKLHGTTSATNHSSSRADARGLG